MFQKHELQMEHLLEGEVGGWDGGAKEVVVVVIVAVVGRRVVDVENVGRKDGKDVLGETGRPGQV